MRAAAVVTTVGTEEQANLIAREIIARRQAACVNIVPGVRSIYRWQGKICSDAEFLLIAKTLESEFDAVAATIRELHSYELP
ncbi:MAG TPA: divalent-cation tolerance protein CutA, partial [Thermoanaerobaculia bacterium]|nr:divalent-cation tolerance protein CutA [Thermoanaerobaculia bacterium]